MAFDYYLRGHRGAGSSNIAEAGGFWRSPLAPDERCDVQFPFRAGDAGRPRPQPPARRRLYTLHACFLRPRSRGRLTLTSNHGNDKPRIQPGYLSDAEGFDLRMMLECAKVSRAIFAQRAFDPYRGAPIHPQRNDLSDAELIEFIRAKAESVYHPVGTCRMGDDGASVVDAQLRVRGVEGLRVVVTGDADPDRRQHQRADDHDCGAGGGHDQGGRLRLQPSSHPWHHDSASMSTGPAIHGRAFVTAADADRASAQRGHSPSIGGSGQCSAAQIVRSSSASATLTRPSWPTAAVTASTIACLASGSSASSGSRVQPPARRWQAARHGR